MACIFCMKRNTKASGGHGFCLVFFSPVVHKPKVASCACLSVSVKLNGFQSLFLSYCILQYIHTKNIKYIFSKIKTTLFSFYWKKKGTQ